MDDTNKRIYDPYSKYAPNDNIRTTKTGIFYAWAARAKQYVKDPLATIGTADPHKVEWTFEGLIRDPTGTLIGRDWPTEEEIAQRLADNDRKFAADEVSKLSDYHRILPNQLANNYDLPRQHVFEKRLTQNQLYVNFQRNEEVEGEKLFERRLTYDWDFILHHVTLGWYKWDPHKSKSAVPLKIGYGTGESKPEKPVRGPNIRGRYARDLRGDNDVLYEFTNLSDCTNLGSDNGGRG